MQLKPRNSMKNQGFTLVELSIVLVIIGLLIGGILVAQSMISTARTQAFVRQIQQYDVAVTNHMTKYNTWPGDDDLYMTATRSLTAAKNDGQVTDDDDADNNTYQHLNEQAIYFAELQVMDNLVVESCPQINLVNNFITTSGANCNTPLGKLGKNNMILVFSNQHGGAPGYVGNYYFFVDCTGTDDHFSNGPGGGCNSPLSGAEALAYDAKIDDGVANTGKVLGYYNAPISNMIFSPSGTASYNLSSSAATYRLVQKVAPDIQL